MLGDKFWSKVDKTDSCWNWKKGKTTAGYGMIHLDRKHQYAHRLSYEYFKGKIPKGLQIDHLCKNRKCVNPDHLEAVTSRENTLRGNNIIAKNLHKTHCVRGHEFTEKNTHIYVDKSNYSHRCCRTCMPIYKKHKNTLRKIEVKLFA